MGHKFQKQMCVYVSHTAGSKGHAIFVLLIWVQHAQGDCQLPFAVRYDGKGQRAAGRLLTVVGHDVLVTHKNRRKLSIRYSKQV